MAESARPLDASASTIAKTCIRALAAATVLLSATCFGQGVSPLAVGYLNDVLTNTYGVEALRYSLLIAALATALAALFGLQRADDPRGHEAGSGVGRARQ
jgi:hypothetical protein